MMELGDRLGAIITFSQMEELLENARLEVSVWRGRRVTVEEFKGSVSVADIIGEVYRLINRNPHYSEEEREHGKRAAEMIDQLYFKAERIKQNALNLRMKYGCYFVSVLTDTTFIGENYLVSWEWGDRKLFNYYTKEQWEKTYKIPLPAPRIKVITGRWERYDPDEQMMYLIFYEAQRRARL